MSMFLPEPKTPAGFKWMTLQGGGFLEQSRAPMCLGCGSLVGDFEIHKAACERWNDWMMENGMD